MQCVIIRGVLYVQGTTDAERWEEYNVYSFDLGESKWRTLPRPPVKYCGLGHITGILLAVGGLKVDKTVSNAIYAFVDDEWKVDKIPCMSIARHSACVLSFQSKLVVVGGKVNHDNAQCTQSVEVYSNREKRWYGVMALPKAGDNSSIVIGNSAYVLGKGVYCASIKRFHESCMTPCWPNMNSRAWKAFSDTPLQCSSAATLGCNLLAIGGSENSGTLSNRIHMYDINSCQWKHLMNLPSELTPSVAFGVAVLSQNEFFVIGGFDSDSNCRLNTMYKCTLNKKKRSYCIR